MRFDCKGSLVGRSVLGDPAKILKMHQNFSRQDSRDATFDVDGTTSQLLSPSKADRQSRRTSASVAEQQTAVQSPLRKLVPISETDVQSRISSLMEKEKRNQSNPLVALVLVFFGRG